MAGPVPVSAFSVPVAELKCNMARTQSCKILDLQANKVISREDSGTIVAWINGESTAQHALSRILSKQQL